MKTETIERESKSITWVWNKKLSQKLLQMIFFFIDKPNTTLRNMLAP